MSNVTAIAQYEAHEIESYRSAQDLRAQVNLIQDVMKAVMRENEHYGKIPGCGDKPTLLQPGAQKLIMTFRLVPDAEVSVSELPHPSVRGHREYRVKVRMATQHGTFLGAGIGSCNTMEKKYRFRPGPMELTGKPVPKGYWDLRKESPAKALELLGGKGHVPKKDESGQWVIAIQGDPVEHDNPADYYNTCEKMAYKRALVSATLTVTAASDIFTQDIEDMDHPFAREEIKEEPKDPPISVAQINRLWTLAKQAGRTPDQVKAKLAEYGIESSKDIRQSQYDEICVWVTQQSASTGAVDLDEITRSDAPPKEKPEPKGRGRIPAKQKEQKPTEPASAQGKPVPNSGTETGAEFWPWYNAKVAELHLSPETGQNLWRKITGKIQQSDVGPEPRKRLRQLLESPRALDEITRMLTLPSGGN